MTGRHSVTSTTCAVCGSRVRVSKGMLVQHRTFGSVCANSRAEASTNDRGARDLACGEVVAS